MSAAHARRLLAASAFPLLAVACNRGVTPPIVAAASDLNAAMPALVHAFHAATGHAVTPVLGSSGNLTQQVRNGAPFEVFLSADESYVRALHQAGLTTDTGALYAIGHLGVFVPNGSSVRADADLRGIADAARDGSLQKLAIANPEHAPYGRTAREALQRAGLWDAVQRHLVLGENVAQATQFATTGSAQAGIIPHSLARTDAVQAAGTFVPIADSLYTPLRQRAVLLNDAGPVARAFYEFLFTAPARDILSRYGFGLPGAER